MVIRKQNKKIKSRTRPKADGQKIATKQDVRMLGVMVEAMDKSLRLALEKN